MKMVVDVIAEYLLSNRRLVVPAFGAFMVKESGERVFSDLLRTDDGVLASLLRDKGLNEMEVAVTIDRFIFEVRHELEQYGYCRLGEVGTLRVEPDTKVLRLYEPVKSVEMPIPTPSPYVPEPISEEEIKELEAKEEAMRKEREVAEKQTTSQGTLQLEEIPQPTEKVEEVVEPQPAVEEVVEPQPAVVEPQPTVEEVVEPQPAVVEPQPKAKPRRRKFDLVMLLAIIIAVMALSAIAYGIYVGSIADYADAAADDAQMAAKRVTAGE